MLWNKEKSGGKNLHPLRKITSFNANGNNLKVQNQVLFRSKDNPPPSPRPCAHNCQRLHKVIAPFFPLSTKLLFTRLA